MLGSCEQLLLDLGNLAGKRGRTADYIPKGHVTDPGATDDPDPAKCQLFRDRWSPWFLGLDKTGKDATDDELFRVRYRLRRALIHGGPEDLEELAIRMAHRTARATRPDPTDIRVKWFDLTLPDGSTWKAPILFDFPRALAAALVSFIGKGRKLVCCPQCGRCAIGRSNQRFCPGGKCRRAWHRHQPKSIEQWRAYMRQYMAHQRAQDRIEEQAADRKKEAKKRRLQKRDKEHREWEATRHKLYQSR